MKERKEVADEFKWNLSDIYNSVEDFKKHYNEVKNDIPKILEYKGKLNKPKKLKECLDFEMKMIKSLNKLSIYTNLLFDEDHSNDFADSLNQKTSDLYSEFFSKTTFVQDEIIKIKNTNKILNDKNLKEYKFYLERILRQKEHFLSEKEESILSQFSDTFGTSEEVYNVLKNTELKFPKIVLKSGEEIDFDESTFRELKQSDVREDRKTAFDVFWKVYDEHKNTFTKLIFKDVRTTVISTNIRGYDSCLEKTLFSNNIDVSIYDGLVDNVSKKIPNLTKYLDYRKDVLGYDKLYYYDLSNSIIPSVKNDFSYEKAKELVLDSTSILGEEYSSIMNKAFNDGWIDVYPNKYKDPGAYMQGSLYDLHPYILMNYIGKYNDVSTLTHELGHAAHSYYSNKNQNFIDSQYSTFIAEIASTTNEVLLFHKMIKETEDKDFKRFLLSKFIDNFRTTVFRQTMFAEFERYMYEIAETGDMFTADMMNKKYLELLKKYHGDSVIIDELYSNEWQFVPHFYYNFYVYQYATSFISSVLIAQRIVDGDEDQLEKYIELLKSGGSDYPVNLLKKSGVDLTDEKCYDTAFKAFDESIEKLIKL